MKILITNKAIVSDMPESLRAGIRKRLTFPNPQYLENQRMGRWQGDTPRLLKFHETDESGALIIPRGFISQLVAMAREAGEAFQVVDHRRELPASDFQFTGKLRPYQNEAVDNMLPKHFGTLAAPTGSGKTIMALAIIAQRRQPTLIIVHTKDLAFQWVDRIHSFLGLAKEQVGLIGAGKKHMGRRITVALVQSLFKCADEVAPHIGHLVVDECHRSPSRTFTEAVTAFDSKYMLALSATPWRRDGLSKLIFWHLGDVRYQIDADQLVDSGSILKAEIITRETDFRPFSDPSAEYSKVLSELTEDTERNRLIAADIAKEALNGGGICLALSDRKSHCAALRLILADEFGISAEVLTGDIPTLERQALVERLNAGKVKVLVATGQLIGEGFDCRGLSTLFLCTPIRFSGRLLQYLGRVLRPARGKEKARVYDYIDLIVYEQAHHRGGAATACCVGLVSTVQEFAAEQGIELMAVHTGELKRWATGKGNAGKGQMIEAAQDRGWHPTDDNEADAQLLLEFALESLLLNLKRA